MSGFVVRQPGLLSLLQDRGRFGRHGLGLTTGGPLDIVAFYWANRLLDNDANATCIEISFGGLELEADIATSFTLTGAEAPCKLNGESIPQWQTLDISPGDRLEIERLPLRHGFTVELAGCFGTGERETGGDIGFEFEPAEADFDAGRVGIVVEQAISPVKGDDIQRAAGSQTEFVGAEAAAILQQAEQPGLLDGKTAHNSPPSSRNRSRSMASKRTRSPTSTGMLGVRVASNMRVGHSPIRFQPPGEVAG